MKKLKSKKSCLKNKIKNSFNELIHNPFGFFREIFRYINLYVATNVFFCLFVLFNVVNGVIIRYFTTGSISNLFAFAGIAFLYFLPPYLKNPENEFTDDDRENGEI